MPSSRSYWETNLRKAKIEYVFRAYVRCAGGEDWAARYRLLCQLADGVGEHQRWSENVVVDGEPQQWIVWGFKDHALKLRFEAGVPEIMARQFEMAADGPMIRVRDDGGG